MSKKINYLNNLIRDLENMHRQRSLERMGTDFQREPTIIFNSRNVKVGDLLKLRNQANKTESSPTKTREFFSNKKLYDSIEITNEQLDLSGENENQKEFEDTKDAYQSMYGSLLETDLDGDLDWSMDWRAIINKKS